MTIVNIWMGFDDRAASTAKTPDEFGQFSDAYQQLGDPSVINIFREDDPAGPRSYELWSLYYEVDTDQEVRDIRNDLLAVYPGQLRTIGSWWYDEGNMVGTENVYDTRIVTKTWSILNPDYQPDPAEPDFDDRFVLRITGDVEETFVSGHTGDPIFPLHTRILEFIPDVDDVGTRPIIVTDVNLGGGQATRWFG